MSDAISLKTPIIELHGVGEHIAQKLHRLGVYTVQDLFELLPFRIEDRTNIQAIKELKPGEDSVIGGTIQKISSRLSKRGALVVQARIQDESGSIQAVWFNQKYLLKTLGEGMSVLLYGTKRIAPSMGNPFFVKKIIPRLEVAPIYPLTAGLSQFVITRLLGQLQPLIAEMKDVIPPPVLSSLNLPSRRITLDAAHFSPSDETIARARQLLGFEELLVLCLQALIAKQERTKEFVAPTVISNDERLEIEGQLGFELTEGQSSALKTVLEDFGKPYPMNRLLYGEVGSGKTAVGLASAVSIAKRGRRVVWLSPTTTLANQQGEITKKFAKKFGLSAALVTGAKKDDHSSSDIVVGTHALLQKNIELQNVGLVIIDEQHRFGVEQRNLLLKNHADAHLLMMTATPIPRTLAHTLFGHIDITFIQDKPSHQKPISSVVFTDKDRTKVEEHIAKRIAAGQPGYIICPLIDGSEPSAEVLFPDERKAVNKEYERLCQVFNSARIAVLHGRLKAEEKEKVMADFKTGQVDILLATSVIEVGIDNPQATWIMIEEADRFGLSQLHQLRGRVGRGEKESVCFLHNSQTTDRATERLKALVNADNGLEIAEYDLKLRGPGNIAGFEQSGLPEVRYADIGDQDAIKLAYETAEVLVKEDINKYPALKAALNHQQRYGLTTA